MHQHGLLKIRLVSPKQPVLCIPVRPTDTIFLTMERQDVSCTYLAHHELESVIIIIIIIIIIIKIRPLPAGGVHSSIPGLMSAVLQKGLEQLKAVYTEAEQAGITSLGTLIF